jgi:CheY-like chemotaxis protein
MEAIGTLAGGVAHDFNNILSAIYGYLNLAKRHVDKPEKLTADLEEIVHGASRAEELVKQILSFSRTTDQEMQPLVLSTIIKEALKLIRSSIPASIEIKQDIETDYKVLAVATQIHQVIMNLCTNAYHAIKDNKGVISLTLHEFEISESVIVPLGEVKPGHYLRLTVSDTGCGIDKENIDKIFEPYFTTKKAGEGTGLGLSVIHGIVTNHNGYITVYTESGQGTSFHLYFPIYKGPDFKVEQKVEEKPIRKGDERILLVDDEPGIINIFNILLADYGYTITAFSESSEAFLEFEKNPHKYDLLVSDLTMPGLSGDELIKKCQEVRADIPVILCSGYSRLIVDEKTKDLKINAYIQKPLHEKIVAQTVREVLDNSK